MIIIDLDGKDNWGLIKQSLMITKYHTLFSFIGYFLIKSELKKLKLHSVQYLQFKRDTESNRELGLYLCGLFSRYLNKNFYLMCGDEYIIPSDAYYKGYNGEKYGNKGLDSYLRFIRKRVRRLQGGSTPS